MFRTLLHTHYVSFAAAEFPAAVLQWADYFEHSRNSSFIGAVHFRLITLITSQLSYPKTVNQHIAKAKSPIPSPAQFHSKFHRYQFVES